MASRRVRAGVRDDSASVRVTEEYDFSVDLVERGAHLRDVGVEAGAGQIDARAEMPLSCTNGSTLSKHHAPCHAPWTSTTVAAGTSTRAAYGEAPDPIAASKNLPSPSALGGRSLDLCRSRQAERLGCCPYRQRGPCEGARARDLGRGFTRSESTNEAADAEP